MRPTVDVLLARLLAQKLVDSDRDRRIILQRIVLELLNFLQKCHLVLLSVLFFGILSNWPFLFHVKVSRSFCPSISMSSRIGTKSSGWLAFSMFSCGSVSSKHSGKDLTYDFIKCHMLRFLLELLQNSLKFDNSIGNPDLFSCHSIPVNWCSLWDSIQMTRVG